MKSYFLTMLMILTLAFCRGEKKEPMSWWTDARFGMFIHWDMSSLDGTEISWSRKATKPLDVTRDKAGYIKDQHYDNLYKNFNPVKFNAREWVAIAKAAGMKYIVFTAKHHGGFCMWDTRYTDYNIMNTPFHRDVVGELAAACREAHMPLGIYYSPRDWHQPDYGIGDNRKYVDYMNGQVRELLTRYGDIKVIWWDSYGSGDLNSFWRVGETFDIVKKLQPGIVMNNRLAVLGEYNKQPEPWLGDFDTPEQRLGEFQNTRPWESCMSIVTTPDGGGWSYRPDGKVKDFQTCLKTLVSCTSGDGNLLLDVGPDATGVIPEGQVDVLRQVGAWLHKYGESIYGTRGGPFLNGAWGGSTFKGNTVYLHVNRWNGEQLMLPALKAKIVAFTCLTAPNAALKVVQTGEGIAMTLPKSDQDSVDTIIRLVLSGSAGEEMVGGKPLEMPDRMQWFKDAKFGLFIHWGLYSALAGEWQGSRNAPTIWGYDAWIQLFANISASDYLGVARKFNPVKFDAREIVAAAKNAGMKYLVITTKHHDGFCMYDSKFTDFDIIDATPFKRDPVKELSDECKRQGIVFCVYYSIPDWHNPDMPAAINTYGYHSQPDPNADKNKYIDYICNQVRELLVKYDPKMIWFDRGDGTVFDEKGISYATAVNAKKIIETIRSVNPNVLINNRLDTAADFVTPEQAIPGKKASQYFESCMTMGKAWGYTSYDSVKSAAELIRNLCDIAHKGGNYLLNIGPKGDGSISAPQLENLKQIGDWMKVNGEAIHGSEKSPWNEVPEWGRFTRKGNTLYMIVFGQPDIGFAVLRGIKEMPMRVRQLDQSGPVCDLRPRILHDELWMLIQEKFIKKEPMVFALDFLPGVLDKIGGDGD